MNEQNNLLSNANATSATNKIMKAQAMRSKTTKATNFKRKYLPRRNNLHRPIIVNNLYNKVDNRLVSSFNWQTIPSTKLKGRIYFGKNTSKGNKRERQQQDDGGLLISTIPNNEMELLHNIKSIQHSNSSNLTLDKTTTTTTTKRREQSMRLFALVLSISLTCIQNASPCSSFGDFERNYDFNIFGNNYVSV